ncbi:putative pectinesterase [Helianthus anomalus]
MQAVALRIAGNKAVLYRVRILGTQDTLLDETGSHYFYQRYIQGSVDFIFGNARSLDKVRIIVTPQPMAESSGRGTERNRLFRSFHNNYHTNSV